MTCKAIAQALGFLLASLHSGLCSAGHREPVRTLTIPGLEAPIHGSPLPCLCSEILVKIKYGFIILKKSFCLQNQFYISTI